MSKLSEMIVAVREQHLTKDQLENYYTELTNLLALMLIRRAELEKESALFLDQSEETNHAAKVRKWKVQKSGQEEIHVKSSIEVAKALIASIKSRLYNFL